MQNAAEISNGASLILIVLCPMPSAHLIICSEVYLFLIDASSPMMMRKSGGSPPIYLKSTNYPREK
jgi:hypothetical protein